ncbi:hypothetical protein BJY04DRAFT_233302 [Aspergillus karnatakaensis]|uniref:uncharacterized protein n=1 Tax=Aspergillus karnatakaensis TaxID=1810916 RepID=UPI003CCDCF71
MKPILIALSTALGAANALGPRTTVSLSSVSQPTWKSFNESVGGHLYDGEPMLAPCFIRYDGHLQRPDARECALLQANRNDPVFTAEHFGGYRNVNWGACQATGESCVFGSRNPDLITPLTRQCYQGSVPTKYVDARSVGDIQQTLQFARTNNLRLVVKNTGHDYTGRSSGQDALGLWVHNIQPPIEHKQDFIPDGCNEPVGDVISFGAGQQFAGIYEFAREHNYRVVGGTSNTVGAAGGWITGGGHSLLSNELGLGVDNVQQLKAVLPNGAYVTANRCQNQDIFFALRGGGGGTFGVVTEMSTLVHPEKPMVTAVASFTALDSDSASELISIIVANADKWATEGWGGYIQIGLLDVGATSFFMATSMLNQSAAEASMKPVTNFALRVGKPALAGINSTKSYFEVLNLLIGDGSAQASGDGEGMAMSSRIITREYFEGAMNQKNLSSILHNILVASQNDTHNLNLDPPMAPLYICVTAPTVYSQNLPESDKSGEPGAPSVTPAWRTGIWHVIHLRPFAGTTTRNPDAVRDIFQNAHDTVNPLREFTPNAGAYLNEADAFETDPVGAFWGEDNYAQLLKIKQEVDPTNLLTVHGGVGWDREDGRFSCYPDVEI